MASAQRQWQNTAQAGCVQTLVTHQQDHPAWNRQAGKPGCMRQAKTLISPVCPRHSHGSPRCTPTLDVMQNAPRQQLLRANFCEEVAAACSAGLGVSMLSWNLDAEFDHDNLCCMVIFEVRKRWSRVLLDRDESKRARGYAGVTFASHGRRGCLLGHRPWARRSRMAGFFSRKRFLNLSFPAVSQKKAWRSSSTETLREYRQGVSKTRRRVYGQAGKEPG
ncbi:hypothetical protein CTAM01_12754 [Colletotrichum tamarilloi]|uniref:Uncharacterized protein n=1 Tax=Colletotrichum tamarilloi TaxID=1209934 RepID=A0ABQ9T7Y6_9PEZI|nr:uncharacterized protein CTAM01_12754 [Colletotrichum tamarilloi]KAK1731989.1 hypothetical protein CTAM01_12754 [Colletotrichum tamarilloi]